MSEILNDLFGFFKHSTARRADVIEVRKDMDGGSGMNNGIGMDKGLGRV